MPLIFLFLYHVGVLDGDLDGVPCYLKAAYRLVDPFESPAMHQIRCVRLPTRQAIIIVTDHQSFDHHPQH